MTVVKLTNIIGIIGAAFIVIGLYVLLSTSGFLPPQLSFVSVGPVTVGDISEENANRLFVGSVLLIVGIGLVAKSSQKKRRKR